MKKIVKRIVIILIIIGLVIGGIFAAYKINQSKKTADVVSLETYYIGDYWGDSIQSYGTVASDQAQAVYLTSKEKIISVNVKQGDHVEAGDVLVKVQADSVDVKGKELALEQAELDYKISKIKLERLQKKEAIPDPTKISTISTEAQKKTADYFDYEVTDSNFAYVSGDAKYDPYDTSEKDKRLFARVYVSFEDNKYTPYQIEYFARIAPKDGTHDEGVSLTASMSLNGDLSPSTTTVNEDYTFPDTLIDKSDLTNIPSTIKIVPHYPTYTDATHYLFEDRDILGTIRYDENGNIIEDYELPQGYTAQELADAITTATADLARKDLALRKMRLELQRMKETADSGEIKAKVSGTVTKVQDKDNTNFNSAFIIITGTDEYYISATIGEFYLDNVKVGDTVSVSSWETGAVVDATITSIGDIPTTDNHGWSNSGTASSNYEFRASFDTNSGIELGTSVDINITPADQTAGFYIYSAFIRKDDRGSYVMRMNDEQVLERVDVTVGKSLWGSYSEIKSGNLESSDYLAFPYGNGAIEGVTCNIVDYLE